MEILLNKIVIVGLEDIYQNTISEELSQDELNIVIEDIQPKILETLKK